MKMTGARAWQDPEGVADISLGHMMGSTPKGSQATGQVFLRIAHHTKYFASYSTPFSSNSPSTSSR